MLGFLSAHELAVIIVVWILVIFGPLVAQIAIAFVRRRRARRDPTDPRKPRDRPAPPGPR